LTKWWDISR